jgi:hypothetical protein
MGYEGYVNYDGTEVVNHSRTVQLARALGVTTVVVPPSRVNWIDGLVGGAAYGAIANAPWYDAAVPASAEFAGMFVMRIDGLDDSTMQSTVVEYVTDGGHSGRPRATTQSLVFDARLVASTERGAEFGKRWIARRLSQQQSGVFCSGADMSYFRLSGVSGNEKVHRRDVRLTRGLSITKKVRRSCSSVWWTTFTMTAADPYEYGEEVPKITSLGADTGSTGPGVLASGALDGLYSSCPPSAYSPVYDPQFPAMVSAPSAPDFFPTGWDLTEGQPFKRKWARISVVEPDDLRTVPILKLRTTEEARMVRVSIMDSAAAPDEQCDVLWSAIVTYLPANTDFYIDGEAKAAYTYDGFSTYVLRADSLVYGPDAEPIRWDALTDPANLLVALDIFTVPNAYNTVNLVTNTFEAGAEGYTAVNGTVGATTERFLSGAQSLKVTATAAGDVTLTPGSASWKAVTPGKRYSVRTNIRSSTNSKNLVPKIEWLDAANAVIGSVTGGAVASVTTGWTEDIKVLGIAPAGAVKARAVQTIQAAAAAGVHYIDNVSLNEEQDTYQGGGNVRASLGLMAKSD